MSVVISFPELSAADVGLAGGKGANLGELTRAGFEVPPGFVISTDAYRAVAAGEVRTRVLAAAEGDPEQAAEIARAAFDTAPIRAEIEAEIVRAYGELAGGRPDAAVAVRSSATAEDLQGASFAGQQETFLNVRGEQELMRAVRRCWASLWTARALDYRRRHGIAPDEVALAVVVQVMVDAESAGVAFTGNPANGRRDQVAIDAAWGLGEAIVSGLVTPDHLVVDKAGGRVLERVTAGKAVRTVVTPDGTGQTPVPAHLRLAQVLSDADAARLAALVTRIEQHFDAPQDVEWARAGHDFWIVQSRPITALPEPVGDVPTEWPVSRKGTWYFRASIVEQMPDPLTPLFGDLIGPAVLGTVTALMERFFGEGTLKPQDAAFERVNGYAYLAYRMSAIARLTAQAIPAMAKLNRDPALSAERLWGQMHADYVAAAEAAEATPPTQLSAPALLDEVDSLLHAGARYYTAVQTVIPQAATAEIYFTRAYAAIGRLPGVRPEDFLLGLDSAPILADKDLWDLAQWAKQRPALAEALRAGGPGSLDAVDEPDAEAWRQRFEAHLERYGHTIYNLDFVNPTPADDPAPILEALRYYLGGEATSPYERQARDLDRRRAAFAALNRTRGVRTRTLRRLQARYELYGPMREDALADVGLAWPRMRADLAELGARFAEAGLIGQASDVYWLTLQDAATAASALAAGATTLPVNTAIEERKAIWRGQKAARPPQLLPRGASAKIWERFMPSVEQQTGNELKGIGSSGGVVTGPARVIRGPADFATMRPGEVLVAEITTPAYTPLFALAAAVVTDVGGPLSHSSIVAREYGIPAVLGTGSATARIATGQVVTVDGTAGRVLLGD